MLEVARKLPATGATAAGDDDAARGEAEMVRPACNHLAVLLLIKGARRGTPTPRGVIWLGILGFSGGVPPRAKEESVVVS